MLPLWIIDITNQPGRKTSEAPSKTQIVSSKRQKRFVELLRQIEHVHIPKRIVDAQLAEANSEEDEHLDNEKPFEGEYGSSMEYINSEMEDDIQTKEIGDIMTTKEIIELF